MPERIQLTFGSPHWLFTARFALAVIAALNILVSGISLSWKIPLVAALALLLWVSPRGIGTFTGWTMRSDGTLGLNDHDKHRFRVVEGSAWLSRWISVFRIRDLDSGRVRTCVVAAAQNHEDDYRRMLVFLRMRPERKEGISVW